MKKLKKVLAVVLTVALMFSIMAVASAATLSDYSDATSISTNYKEAVRPLLATRLPGRRNRRYF